MKPEQAAYVNLVAIARADRRVSQDELSLLEEYREVLGISKGFAEEIEGTADLHVVIPRELNGRPADRLQIVKMMLRVGYADGEISIGEKRLLKKVARSLGVGPIALPALFWEVEKEFGIRRSLRLFQIVAGSMIVVAGLAIWFALDQFGTDTNREIEAARLEFERAQADDARRRVRQAREDRKKDEARLAKRLEELEAKNAKERKDQQTALTAEIDALKTALGRVRDLNATFQEIEKRSDPSILLILVTYDLVLGADRFSQASMGTGFFATSDGHIVTNKHVVEPWKFDADQVALLDSGASVDEASLFMAAWTAGSEVKGPKGGLNLDGAFTTTEKTLKVERTTPDTYAVQHRPLRSGKFYKGQFHTANSGDLAVLKAAPPAAVHALPLEPDLRAAKKLDTVLVQGFPTGIHILETTKAATSPSLGEIRKIESSIMVTAPIVPGNSGGPLIDSRGNVAGVAAANFGDSTLGSCIPTEHVLPLLPTAPELLARIEKFEAAGEFRAALDDLRLAGQRCDDDAVRRAIDATRARIFKTRDERIAAARKIEELQAQRGALKKIVASFGSRWAAEAVELIEK